MPVNKVFQAVKKYYSHATLSPAESYSSMQSELQLSDDQLQMHLQILSNMNLIRYSTGDHSITLTPLGEKAPEVTTMQVL